MKPTHKLILSGSIAAALLAPMLAGASVAPSFTFLGVAAGDASDTGATVWTRGIDSNAPANTNITLQVSTDPGFSTFSSLPAVTDATKDYTAKLDISALSPATVYYYRFVEPVSAATSIVGRFKTAPSPTTPAAVHFAFSGDNDGLIRPYALANVMPAQNLDFYINLGDVIYENASNLTTSGAHNGEAWLNSPSVTLSNSALNLNSVPVAGTTFAMSWAIANTSMAGHRPAVPSVAPVAMPSQPGAVWMRETTAAAMSATSMM